MDLNYLYHRQQVEHMRAGEAACPQARSAHLALATAYAGRIASVRAQRPEMLRLSAESR